MPTRSPQSRPKRPRGRPGAGAGPALRALQTRLARLTAQVETLRRRHARELAAARRAADRRLAAVMREITALRYHQARADALARLLAERDIALARQTQRIAELEAALLRTPTQLG